MCTHVHARTHACSHACTHARARACACTYSDDACTEGGGQDYVQDLPTVETQDTKLAPSNIDAHASALIQKAATKV